MKFVRQFDAMDCGPSCLSMIANHYGKFFPLQFLRENSFLTREGVSLLGISQAADKIGFNSISAQLTIDELENMEFPCILHWNQNHFVVLRGVENKGKRKWKLADPRHGFITLGDDAFKKSWLDEDGTGVGLFLEPTEKFYEIEIVNNEKFAFRYVKSYLKKYKRELSALFVLLLIGSSITLVFPFLAQKLIDKGVSGKNMSYIRLILLAQLGLFLGSITIEIIRNWIMLYLGTKLSVTIISEFLAKMLQLPIKFFDSKMMGDFNQRIQDNGRIENFLTSQTLLTVFSFFTFIVFFGVLCYYDYKILLVYMTLSGISIYWSFTFLKKRKVLDYYKFQQLSINQDSVYEILNGVSEMKLNDFTDYKLTEWKENQKKLFDINVKMLKIDQLELSGFEFINQLKNIVVTFLAAKYVVAGEMTLGALLSVSYIIGQMNSPISQLMNFFRSLQDAKLSLERLNEVQNHEVEEQDNQALLDISSEQKTSDEPRGISLENLCFQYEGEKSNYILEDINFFIPEGKITAIVGASGSGKTTLIKLLLKFYNPSKGKIKFNGTDILDLSPKSLRDNCGVVMQDGFIFSDSIERNIACGDEMIDFYKLNQSAKVANIYSFIETLPLGFHTKIGSSGNGISGGQKQRILIARAVYKNPHYILFDEATSALDAENEKVIHDNLQEFFAGKTVVIVAHRLSTVKNADQIIVLKHGKVMETGNHNQLVENRSEYYNLVKNQLELGN